MSNVTTANKAGMFPNSNTKKTDGVKGVKKELLKRNSDDRKKELDDMASKDSKVSISDGIKDFSRIKKVADAAPEINKSDKIAALKQQIKDGTYQIDDEAIADKILETEF